MKCWRSSFGIQFCVSFLFCMYWCNHLSENLIDWTLQFSSNSLLLSIHETPANLCALKSFASADRKTQSRTITRCKTRPLPRHCNKHMQPLLHLNLAQAALKQCPAIYFSCSNQTSADAAVQPTSSDATAETEELQLLFGVSYACCNISKLRESPDLGCTGARQRISQAD